VKFFPNTPQGASKYLLDMDLETKTAPAFAARLRKNKRHLERYARRVGTDAYRVYDRDLPEFHVAIDVYADRACVAEYVAPKEIDEALAAARLRDATRVAAEVLGIVESAIHVKHRRRLDPASQYQRLARGGERFVVREGAAKLLVNLSDRIDTGIYLDHRLTRQRVAELARDRRLLNLFCYTATATVQAALGGATSSVSVDLSNTYLDWAAANFDCNDLNPDLRKPAHRLVRADCRRYVADAREVFDVVFVDPPTYSNSRATKEDFEVARDHAELLLALRGLLTRDGVIVFATHARRFHLDPALERDFEIRDITAKTVPEDFRRDPKVHRCYELRVRG
jgi:23S rRNA (guanine2445-N2)-methyltransferase / 23S rRNA (guanine2069-N7)-methyltransferase